MAWKRISYSFAAIRNSFHPIKYPKFYCCYLYPNSPKKIKRCTIAFSEIIAKCSFYVVILQRMVEKPTRLYFACTVTLFCSLTVLFGGVLHDVTVVVFLTLQ